jgi:glycosyltransferase involved in cell wall biosynthesis
VFVHDRDLADRARAELGVPADRLVVVEHPAYPIAPARIGRTAARDRLGIPADHFAVLCFGKLRRDKELGVLLEALELLPGVPLTVVVAGALHDASTTAACEAMARRDPRLLFLPGVIPDDSVSELFAAADLFVQPRSDGWTSGSLTLALSLGVPIVAADQPAYRRLIGADEAGWTYRGGDARALAAVLAAASQRPLEVERRAAAAARRGQALPDWSWLARLTAGALQDAPRAEPEPEPATALGLQLDADNRAA